MSRDGAKQDDGDRSQGYQVTTKSGESSKQ
jgi:hypothetical protein